MGPQRLESVPEPAERRRGGKLCLGVTEQDSGEQSREGVGIEEDSGTRGLQRGESVVGGHLPITADSSVGSSTTSSWLITALR